VHGSPTGLEWWDRRHGRGRLRRRGYGLLYAAGWSRLDKRVWAAALLAGWVVLAAVAPSFVWLGVVVFLVVLQWLPAKVGFPLVVAGAVFAAVEGFGYADRTTDPSPVIAALALGALAIVLAGQRVRGSLGVHDRLAKGLASSQRLLSAAEREWTSDPERAKVHVQQAARAVQENLAELRRFIREHAPEDQSLPAALRRICEDTEGVAVQFRLIGEPYPVNADTEAALLRVAQGALVNVREHAKATNAIVTLGYVDHELTLDVSDNGLGDDTEVGHGLVLRATSQRMEALGGKVTVESVPGRGTVLVVSVPARERK